LEENLKNNGKILSFTEERDDKENIINLDNVNHTHKNHGDERKVRATIKN
jgi:hypothetical protein